MSAKERETHIKLTSNQERVKLAVRVLEDGGHESLASSVQDMLDESQQLPVAHANKMITDNKGFLDDARSVFKKHGVWIHIQDEYNGAEEYCGQSIEIKSHSYTGDHLDVYIGSIEEFADVVNEQVDEQVIDNHNKPELRAIDDPGYVFIDDDVCYSHCDFRGDAIDDSCIYLNTIHNGEHLKTIMIGKI
ncbi:MAG: hypothetical protein ACPH3C_06480, partial [Glaciecola sp.]